MELRSFESLQVQTVWAEGTRLLLWRVRGRQWWASVKGIRGWLAQAVTLIHQVTILSSCKMASVLPDFPLAQSLLASCGFSLVK